MAVIFINGFNAKVGGGKSILNNYLSLLHKKDLYHNYYVLTPDFNSYVKYEKEGIKIVELRGIYNNNLFFPLVYSYILDRLMRKYRVDLVFNLADIPIKTSIKQVFLFDWSYAVYPESRVWRMMSLKDFLIRKVKLLYFKKYLKYIDTLIAQTEAMKDRLYRYYKFENIRVVPNAVSLDNLNSKSLKNFNLPEGIKLLYLTHYYPHKNIEIFLDLAQKIKLMEKNYKLVVTIESNQSNKAKHFLDKVKSEELDNIIINVGSVNMVDVPQLYKQSDALLMPTLLESFSGTYVEAMYHQKPIFTSNLDFAIGVCKDGAAYFDPEDASDIYLKVNSIFDDEIEKKKLVMRGNEVLIKLPDWPKVIEMFNEIIDQSLETNSVYEVRI